MNIFEALEAGDGKATLPEWQEKCFVFANISGCFEWETCGNYFGLLPYIPPMYRRVEHKFLKRTDWVPYVPCETKTNKVTVFENIKWEQTNYMPVIYPVIQQDNLSFFKMKSLVGKPLMKMTLEWTEEIKPND